MLKIEQLTPTVDQILVSQRLTEDDVRKFVAFAEGLDGAAKSNLLFEVADIDGLDFSAVWQEMSHFGALVKMLGKLDRIAIVADEPWLRTAARIGSAMLPGVTYEVFSSDKAGQARDWVLSKIERPHGDAVRVIDVGDPSIVAFELDGRIDRQNAEDGVSQLKATLDASNASRMMARVKNWQGFDLSALGSTSIAKSKAQFIKRLDRYAIVGGPDWLENVAETFGSLIDTEVKTFDLDEEEEALAWLKQ